MRHKREQNNHHLRDLCEQVVRTQADWQNILDSLSDMICILDRDRRIKLVNRAFSTRLKKPSESIIGAHCYEIIHTSCQPPALCPFTTAIETGQSARHETELEVGDVLFAASLIPFRDVNGVQQGAVHIFREITDQEKIKNRSTNPGKMASLGMLAVELAHEINNPLDYISNYLFLLSDSLPPDFPKPEYIKKIEAGIDNLSSLTRDLLECSEPPRDTFVTVDMHRVIDDSLAGSSGHLAKNGIEVVKSYRCDNGNVRGSEHMLRQALLKLIINALDAMPSGGQLIVTTRCERGRFILDMRDTGVGIGAEHLHKIFEPFFTTKKTPEKRRRGLGLTICYNIIHAHDGEIHAESTVNRGTTFFITIPQNAS